MTGTHQGVFQDIPPTGRSFRQESAHIVHFKDISTVSAGGREVWKKKKSGYEGRAEYFGIYSPDTGKVYMISVAEAPRTSSMRLRLKAPKNNQEKNIKWASDYEL